MAVLLVVDGMMVDASDSSFAPFLAVNVPELVVTACNRIRMVLGVEI